MFPSPRGLRLPLPSMFPTPRLHESVTFHQCRFKDFGRRSPPRRKTFRTPAPIADGPLVANPEQDSLTWRTCCTSRPRNRRRRQTGGIWPPACLSLRKYLEFAQRFPSPPRLPWQSTAAAMCLEELGRKEDAHTLFRRLTQTGGPALVAASAYRLATDASAARGNGQGHPVLPARGPQCGTE